jgi:endonuclease IV
MSITLYDNDLLAGLPISIEKVSLSIIQGILDGYYSIEIQLGSTNVITRSRLSLGEIKICETLLKRYPMNIFCRSPLVYNFCGSRSFRAWNNNIDQDTKTRQMIYEIEYELDTISKLGGKVVSFMGSHIDEKSGLQTVAKTVNHIRFVQNSKLLFENSVHYQFQLGYSFDHLRTVYKTISRKKKPYVGFALNLTHLFVSGLYTFDDTRQIFIDFTDVVGTHPEVVFVSDTTTKFGSNRLSLCTIGEGEIWRDRLQSLVQVVEWCVAFKVPLISDSLENIRLIRQMLYIK